MCVCTNIRVQQEFVCVCVCTNIRVQQEFVRVCVRVCVGSKSNGVDDDNAASPPSGFCSKQTSFTQPHFHLVQ